MAKQTQGNAGMMSLFKVTLKHKTDDEIRQIAAWVEDELTVRNMPPMRPGPLVADEGPPVGPFADLVRAMRAKQKAFYATRGGGRDHILHEAKALELQVDRALVIVVEDSQLNLWGDVGANSA